MDFLDTPGTLWGKFEDEKVALHLAYIGSIRDEVLDKGELAFAFLDEVRGAYGGDLAARYGLECLPDDTLALFDAIARAGVSKPRAETPITTAQPPASSMISERAGWARSCWKNPESRV